MAASPCDASLVHRRASMYAPKASRGDASHSEFMRYFSRFKRYKKGYVTGGVRENFAYSPSYKAFLQRPRRIAQAVGILMSSSAS